MILRLQLQPRVQTLIKHHVIRPRILLLLIVNIKIIKQMLLCKVRVHRLLNVVMLKGLGLRVVICCNLLPSVSRAFVPGRHLAPERHARPPHVLLNGLITIRLVRKLVSFPFLFGGLALLACRGT